MKYMHLTSDNFEGIVSERAYRVLSSGDFGAHQVRPIHAAVAEHFGYVDAVDGDLVEVAPASASRVKGVV